MNTNEQLKQACETGNMKGVKLWLSKETDIDIEFLNNCLSIACKHGNMFIAKKLMFNKIDFLSRHLSNNPFDSWSFPMQSIFTNVTMRTLYNYFNKF